jgi:hypothetical protein
MPMGGPVFDGEGGTPHAVLPNRFKHTASLWCLDCARNVYILRQFHSRRAGWQNRNQTDIKTDKNFGLNTKQA